jgi:hypothetical protein
MSYWITYFLILLLGGGGLIALLIYSQRTNKSKPFLINIMLAFLTLFLTFMGLEFYFKLFFAEPDSIGTLARENWRERYANQGMLNSLTYRDKEWTDDMVAGKTKVMVVGDSFVYGDGIENPEDRFSNRLGQKLGDDFVVFNLGKGGTNTKHHINAILNYPYSPDILVFSYVINDITGAVLERQWVNRPDGAPRVLPEIPFLVDNSYALNFFYWRLHRMLQVGQPDTAWQWYLSVYNDPDSWWIHREQLVSIYEGAQSEQIPLFVVVFPSMDFTEESQVVTERIVNLFRERGVPTLDVAELIEGIPKKDRMASSVDAHPSELVHSLVADALYQMFLEEGVIEQPPTP